MPTPGLEMVDNEHTMTANNIPEQQKCATAKAWKRD